MSLLHDLETIQWNVASRVYGNNHAYLVGLFTNWWIAASPHRRWALESGPSYGYRQRGLGGGLCDALLCDENRVVGVLEVEGTRGKYTAEKIGHFFDAEVEYYRSITFGILVLYAYAPVGKGQNRAFRSALDHETALTIADVTSNHPEKQFTLVVIDKRFSRQRIGARARNEYYSGELDKVTGYLYRDGRIIESIILYNITEKD